MKKLIKLYNKFFINSRDKKKFVPLNKVLVVSNTALGDTILSTPAIKTLRKSFPNIYIELLVNKPIYKLFNGYEYVDKVSIFDKSLKGLINYSNYLKKQNFDTIFFLHSNGPQDLFLALYSKVPNILKAINFPSKVSKEFSKFILNIPDYKNKKHIIEHRLDLIKVFEPKIIDKEMNIPNRFALGRPNNKKVNIAIQLAAADTYKMWPVTNFSELIKKINQKLNDNIQFTFFGIEEEYHLSQEVIESLSENISCINLCGKTSIEELPNRLNESDLLITNDTGTLHLSVALKIPSISLFSPTDSKIFGPYQNFDIHEIIQKNGEFINDKPKKQRTQEAMELITVDEVFELVYKQLKRLNKCVES
ncbi:glycosyltransferase family 9 protein [Poseidonibacter lekithochrous]|uniref:glycosyltransferase family 9 protein n=1 Tax=Poseidonibacter lekithochrous TaxID=1904463 RepID=UPI000D3BC1B8|nr:glycosyltransferase family 9 protein [Poseidonibacter lekithochrous]